MVCVPQHGPQNLPLRNAPSDSSITKVRSGIDKVVELYPKGYLAQLGHTKLGEAQSRI